MTTATETSKARARLRTLSASFDQLEAQLEPLFARPLPETLLALDPLQQAKLQTVLPYALYDLIFIYLKAQAVDPKTHPVVSELERIRQYFDKVSNAENPPVRKTEVDKAAATRFIKHAINGIQWQKTAAETAQENDDDEDDKQEGASTSQAPIPVRVTSKMLERAEYEKELKEKMKREEAGGENEDEDEDGLQVFGADEGEAAMDVDANPEDETPPPPPESTSTKSKGKQKETLGSTTLATGSMRSKRNRPAMDPFAASGLGEPEDDPIEEQIPNEAEADENVNSETDTPSKPRVSKKQKKSSSENKKESNSTLSASSPSSNTPKKTEKTTMAMTTTTKANKKKRRN